MIPIKDENPTRRFPVVTTALLVANVLAFLYMVSLGDAELLAAIAAWAFTPARFITEPLSPAVLATFISAMFMHGGWLHLGSNMLYLWIFGNNVEDALGPARFAGFYVTSGVVATVAHMAIGGASDIPLLGASGAVAGVLGAYLLLFPRTNILVLIPIFFILELARIPAAFVIGFWFLMQLIQGVGSIAPGATGGGVAWWAHIGGFIAGLALVLPMRRRGRGRRDRRSRSRSAT